MVTYSARLNGHVHTLKLKLIVAVSYQFWEVLGNVLHGLTCRLLQCWLLHNFDVFSIVA